EDRLGAHLRAEEPELVRGLTVVGLGHDLLELDRLRVLTTGLRLIADHLYVRGDLLADDAEVLVGTHPDVGDALLRLASRLLLFHLTDLLLGRRPDAHDLGVRARFDRAGAVRDRLLETADLALRLLFDRLHHALALVLVDVRHDVEREVEDALEVARRHVEQDAKAARRSLEEPDV